jgi:hypothetical protein
MPVELNDTLIERMLRERAAPSPRAGLSDDIVALAAATPQARRPSWWPFRLVRSGSNRLALVAIAAALIVVAIGLAVVGAGQRWFVIAPSQTPARSPAVTPIASPGRSAMPSEVVGRWMGGHTPVVPVESGTTLHIDPAGFFISKVDYAAHPVLGGSAELVDGSHIRVQASDTSPGCPVGDVGIYSWIRSGHSLIVSLVEDGCAARAGALAGTWWLMGCRLDDDFCLGELDPGTYQSQYVTPLLPKGARPQPLLGGVTYTVPDGWANWSDYPGSFGLGLSNEFRSTTASDPAPAHHIQVLPDVGPASQAIPCSEARDPSVGHTPAAMIAFWRTVRGLEVSAAKSITVGGLSGEYVDLTLDPSTVVPCRGPGIANESIVGFLVADEARYIPPLAKYRVILLQARSDLVMCILFESDAAGFDAFVSGGMPVVRTFTFR